MGGGQIVDGTGAAAVRADLGITGETITAVGDLLREPAGRTIDAAGLTVTPVGGFYAGMRGTTLKGTGASTGTSLTSKVQMFLLGYQHTF